MINSKQWELVNYCEQFWHTFSSFPTLDQIYENVEMYANREEIQRDLDSSPVGEQLNARGIERINKEEHNTKSKQPRQNSRLSDLQIAAVNTILNIADHRSFQKKLLDLGISDTMFGGWLQNRRFLDYYKQKAQKALDEGLPLAHLALIKQASQGNTKAIEFYYKVTGFYTGAESEELLNMKVFIHRIIEIIQAKIDDPDILKAISTEMLSLIGMGEQHAEQIIRGEIDSGDFPT